MTDDTSDPAAQWLPMLVDLTGRRRVAVLAALRSSSAAGWPPDAEAVRLLVAYALGEIGAQDYALGVLAALGADPGLIEQLARTTAPRPAAPPDALSGPAPLQVTSIAPEPRISHDEAVDAYVSGRIAVAEFLRITRGLSA